MVVLANIEEPGIWRCESTMKKTTRNTQLNVCPCDSGKELGDCCGLYHAGLPAPDPETLMRSRYSAYALCLESYVLDTWHENTRPEQLDLDRAIKWIGLDVLSFSEQGDEGWVSFVARYKVNGRAGRMLEKSHFLRESGRWFYLAGAEPVAD